MGVLQQQLDCVECKWSLDNCERDLLEGHMPKRYCSLISATNDMHIGATIQMKNWREPHIGWMQISFHFLLSFLLGLLVLFASPLLHPLSFCTHSPIPTH